MENLMTTITKLGLPTSSSLKEQCYDPVAHARMKARNYNRMPGALTGIDCPRCLNRGQLMIVHPDGTTAIERCECMTVRDNMKRIEQSGLKGSIESKTFDTYTTEEPWQKQAKDLALEYVNEPGANWFLLSGQPGCGKTHLCTAICGELMKKGLACRYVLWRDTVRRLKATVNDPDSYDAMMDDLKRVRLLYIDDFLKIGGGDKPREGDLNVAFELLNVRYANPQLLTIISTERTSAELMAIDEAIGTRIVERCGKFRLSFTGKDKSQRERLADAQKRP